MNVTKTELATEVRARLGDPLVTELSDNAIEQAIDATVNEYSRYRPKHEYRTLNLVKGQAEYTLNTDVIRVTECILASSSEIQSLNEYEGISIWSNPSLLTVHAQKLEAIRRYESEWMFEDGVIRITPAPSTSGLSYYKASLNRTLSTVPDRDKEVFLLFTLGECMEVMGRKRNKKITEVPTGSGEISFDDGKTLRREGFYMKRDFYKRLGGDTSAMSIG